MKTKLLITSLSLIATSAYAQPSIPSVGIPPPTVRAEIPGQGVPSMPQPSIHTPTPQMNSGGPQPAVGMPPPHVMRAEMSDKVGGSMNSQLPPNSTFPPASVGATGGAGGVTISTSGTGTYTTTTITGPNGGTVEICTWDVCTTPPPPPPPTPTPPPPPPPPSPTPSPAKQEAQTKAQGLAAKAQAFSEAREKIYYEMSDKEAAKKASANPDGAKTSK